MFISIAVFPGIDDDFFHILQVEFLPNVVFVRF